jgi:hypothetical protein
MEKRLYRKTRTARSWANSKSLPWQNQLVASRTVISFNMAQDEIELDTVA